MSVQAMTWAFRQDVQPSAAKFVLVALSNHSDSHGYCYPSQRLLAEETGQTDRSVRGHLSVLESAGWIRRERRADKHGHRTSDGFVLIGFLAEESSAGLPATVSARATILPEDSSAGLPEESSEPTGKKRHSLPEDSSATIKGTEPSVVTVIEPSESSAGAKPWDLVVAFYEEAQREIGEAPKRWRGTQCGLAETLITDGCDEQQMRRLSRYLHSQTWRDAKPTMKTASAVYGDWVVEGMPERESARKTPSGGPPDDRTARNRDQIAARSALDRDAPPGETREQMAARRKAALDRMEASA